MSQEQAKTLNEKWDIVIDFTPGDKFLHCRMVFPQSEKRLKAATKEQTIRYHRMFRPTACRMRLTTAGEMPDAKTKNNG